MACSIFLDDNTSPSFTPNNTTYVVPQLNEMCVITIEYDGNQTYTQNVKWSQHPNYNTTRTITSSAKLRTTKTYIGRAGYNNTYQLVKCDLNNVKAWSNGELVYQGCLKIPYTESKTGSKVVDAICRDRIRDMYEQFGYAPYFTVSDSDFTLPMGEIYGMIENLRKLIMERTA